MGQNENPYPSTHTLDPGREGGGYRESQTRTQAPHNSRKPSVHSPGTEAARAIAGNPPKRGPETGGKAAS